MDQKDATNVVITPDYDLETDETILKIRGLKKGAHVKLSVPSMKSDQDIFVGALGKLHAFGFGSTTDNGAVKIGP